MGKRTLEVFLPRETVAGGEGGAGGFPLIGVGRLTAAGALLGQDVVMMQNVQCLVTATKSKLHHILDQSLAQEDEQGTPGPRNLSWLFCLSPVRSS